MMKVLVFGSKGLVGSSICTKLNLSKKFQKLFHHPEKTPTYLVLKKL